MEDEYRAVADVASDNEDEVFDEQLDYDDDESNRHATSSKQSHKGNNTGTPSYRSIENMGLSSHKNVCRAVTVR